MTEEEAKTKWCPFIRITPETEGWRPMTNRLDGMSKPELDGSIVTCLGSKCMAWRFTQVASPNAFDERAKVSRGYCGLAGAP